MTNNVNLHLFSMTSFYTAMKNLTLHHSFYYYYCIIAHGVCLPIPTYLSFALPWKKEAELIHFKEAIRLENKRLLKWAESKKEVLSFNPMPASPTQKKNDDDMPDPLWWIPRLLYSPGTLCGKTGRRDNYRCGECLKNNDQRHTGESVSGSDICHCVERR